jgi:uncharacterized damage-inducible protein DinB
MSTTNKLALDPRTMTADSVRYALTLCLKTARAIPEDKAKWTPSDGDAKSALDVVRHMVEVNHNIAGYLSAQPLSDEDRRAIMDTISTYPQAIEALESSTASLTQVIAQSPEDALRPHLDQWLNSGSPGQLMTVGFIHLVYHWGQLCYLQTLLSDGEDHFLK